MFDLAAPYRGSMSSEPTLLCTCRVNIVRIKPLSEAQPRGILCYPNPSRVGLADSGEDRSASSPAYYLSMSRKLTITLSRFVTRLPLSNRPQRRALGNRFAFARSVIQIGVIFGAPLAMLASLLRSRSFRRAGSKPGSSQPRLKAAVPVSLSLSLSLSLSPSLKRLSFRSSKLQGIK